MESQRLIPYTDIADMVTSFFREDDQLYIENKWGLIENPCLYSASGGHLEVLKWARQNG